MLGLAPLREKMNDKNLQYIEDPGGLNDFQAKLTFRTFLRDNQ